jgi:hypothetical protein
LPIHAVMPLNPGDQVDGSSVQDTTTLAEASLQHPNRKDLPETKSFGMHNLPLLPDNVISKIGGDFGLNEKQRIAFCIIAKFFIENHILKCLMTLPHLTMLMTGPGDTGKTHVMKAVCAVMVHYGYGHIIQFLAPTGSAAALIDSMTVHKVLGIKIKSSNKGKGNYVLGESLQDYSVIVSNKNKTQL